MKGIYKLSLNPKVSILPYNEVYLIGGCCQAVNNIHSGLNIYGEYIDILIPKDTDLDESKILHWVEWGKSLTIESTYLGKVIKPTTNFTSDTDAPPKNYIYYKIRIKVRNMDEVGSNGNKYALFCLSFFRYLFNSPNRYKTIYKAAIRLEELLPDKDLAGLLYLAHILVIDLDNNKTTESSGDNNVYSAYYGLVPKNAFNYMGRNSIELAKGFTSTPKIYRNVPTVCYSLVGGTVEYTYIKQNRPKMPVWSSWFTDKPTDKILAKLNAVYNIYVNPLK